MFVAWVLGCLLAAARHDCLCQCVPPAVPTYWVVAVLNITHVCALALCVYVHALQQVDAAV